MLKEQLPPKYVDWYNALPIEKRRDEKYGYVKFCPCGDKFEYATNETSPLQVDDWILKHFGHTSVLSVAPKKKEFTIGELYDFTKPVRFSREGLQEFIKQHHLSSIGNHESSIRLVYGNQAGDRLTFERRFNMEAPKLFVQIVPELTEVSI